MTNLTEEQAAYVNSIQQACHAINVIAGNVLGQFLLYDAIQSFTHRVTHRFQQGLFMLCRLNAVVSQPDSQLDRNNVELSARPVLVDLRKMVEDQARIIETRDASNPLRAVDVIVFVDSSVPNAVYLDETYTYRVSTACFFVSFGV